MKDVESQGYQNDSKSDQIAEFGQDADCDIYSGVIGDANYEAIGEYCIKNV